MELIFRITIYQINISKSVQRIFSNNNLFFVRTKCPVSPPRLLLSPRTLLPHLLSRLHGRLYAVPGLKFRRVKSAPYFFQNGFFINLAL